MPFTTKELMVDILAFGDDREKKPRPGPPACPNPSCLGNSVTGQPGASSSTLDLATLQRELRSQLRLHGTA
jgi:hypothetical protein